MKNGIKIFGGSVAVYVAMASCAAESPREPSASAPETGGVPAATGGTTVSNGGGLLAGGSSTAPSPTGGALSTGGSSIMNPVPDAGAQPMPVAPTVFEEKCDKMTSTGGPYAEHLFPGKSAAELAATVVVVRQLATGIPGYDWVYGVGAVKDGGVAQGCNAATETVRFVVR